MGFVGDLALGPGGRILAATVPGDLGDPDARSGTDVKLWDLHNPARPALIRKLTGHTDAVTALTFSPDGQSLATASADRTARMWNLGRPGQSPQQTLTGHTEAVTTVTFSRDGKTLGTTDARGTVGLWQFTNPYHPASGTTEVGSPHPPRSAATAGSSPPSTQTEPSHRKSGTCPTPAARCDSAP